VSQNKGNSPASEVKKALIRAECARNTPSKQMRQHRYNEMTTSSLTDVLQRFEEANQSPPPEHSDDVANPTPEHSDDVERLDEAIQNPINWNAMLEMDLEEVENTDEVNRLLHEAEKMSEVELLLEDAERLLEELEKI